MDIKMVRQASLLALALLGACTDADVVSVEVCDDGLDNDRDTHVDCRDPDCSEEQDCDDAPASCETPEVPPLPTFDLGSASTCAIEDGALYCCGVLQHEPVSRPVLMSADRAFAGVALGRDHGCAVADDGSLWCWGDNADGQLGTRDQLPRDAPTHVGGELRVRSLSLGDRHTCAIALDGALYCWGDGSEGQTGLGTRRRSLEPTRVGEQSWVDVAAGANHTCAINADATAYCFGSAQYGALGTPREAALLSPMPIDDRRCLTRITAGKGFACATDPDGKVLCWGSNYEGQLAIDPAQKLQSAALESGVAERVHQLSAGAAHVCAVFKEAGPLLCWGTLSAFQYAGDPKKTSMPIVLKSVAANFMEVRAGGYTTCARDVTGKLYCAGQDSKGQAGVELGDAAVMGGYVAELTPVRF